jgi:hypothetical protein
MSLFCHVAFGQFSTYYGTYNINNKTQITANVNSNINVAGNINKTITTIDYGSLALANAEREKTRLQSIQYANDIERQRALEIASNPMKAFDYGKDNTWQVKGKDARAYGFSKLTWYHKIPHNSFFVSTGGYKYRNVSDKNVTTEIELKGAYNINGLEKELKEKMLKEFKLLIEDIEKYIEFPNDTVGVYSSEYKIFLHKKEVKRAKVFGVDGFKGTVIFESKYDNAIIENYYAYVNGIILSAVVSYSGDKSEVTFEELEGRRYYLKRLCDQIIATSIFSDTKL